MGSPTPMRAEPTRAVFLHSTELEEYAYPPDCPFRTERAAMARAILVSMGLLTGPGRREVAPAPAGADELLRFHTAGYLDALAAAPRGRLDVKGLHMGLGTPDCPVFVGMVEYAALAAGASLAGARLLASGEAGVAFNPSGGYHHAGPARAAGFCYVNDVALACLDLAGRGLRVLYLDVDAHHGDGVQNAFYDRRDVMTISLHESGRTLFPGTGFADEIGVGDGAGYAVNVPLPPRTYDEAFLSALRAVAVPLMAAFDPDAIVLELGLDGLAGDPLTHLALTNNAFVEVVRRVRSLRRPTLVTGGGGYHVEHTARGWALAWSELCGGGGGEDLAAGLGGVMLESTDWAGGLRDRALPVDPAVRAEVAPAVEATIQQVRANVFPYHGLRA